ncbi:MAG: ABC transporter substrate-binding protein [Anaerolineaceae bacterium]|nr:ABC transporter substrate-binding protein [Anaerolineaceae bacterium]
MTYRSLFVVLLVLSLSPLFAAGAQDNVTLGVVMPFTGALGSFGSDFVRGVELAVAQMNAELEAAGSATRFVTASADTEGTPDGSARAVQTVVQTTGANVIVGPLTTSEVLGAKQYADENGVVLVAPASSGPAGGIPGDNIFRVMYPPDIFSAKAYARIAVTRGYQNVAILNLDDPYGNGLADRFQIEFAAAGGGSTTRIAYTPDPPDLSGEIARLSADVASMSESGKTAVLCVCFLGDAQKALQLALVDPLLGTVDWIGNEAMTAPELLEDASVSAFLQNADFVTVGAYSTETPLAARFTKSFTEHFGNPPGPFTNYAFDAANIAMLSILAAGNDGAAVKSMLPFISGHYIGTTVQGLLDDNGDQAIAWYSIYQINADGNDFESVGLYNGSADSLELDG